MKDIAYLSQIAVLTALGKKRKLKSKITEAVNLGIKPERIRESIVQCYLFAGFPAMIEGLRVFSEILNFNSREKFKYDVKKFSELGLKTCRKVYGKSFGKLVENVKKLGSDVFEWMIVEGYGKVLSRKGLSLKERELLNVAVLTALGWKNQLYAHMQGAINTGAKVEEIEAVLSYILPHCLRARISLAHKLLDKIR